MFSDLVGSTALSARMDPEDLRDVISAYQKCVAEIVRRFGGFVVKYMGDGVLVYFGYRFLALRRHRHFGECPLCAMSGRSYQTHITLRRTWLQQNRDQRSTLRKHRPG
jgi:class 3 adenylate cyclase